MANPKRFIDKPECGGNRYEDTAHADARDPIWGVSVVVPNAMVKAVIKMLPNPPAPKPLGPAALKALQKQAEDNAKAKARIEMDAIAAFPCPTTCKKKASVSKDFFDKPAWRGPPRVDVTLFQWEIPMSGVTTIVKVQEWVQDAVQDYSVLFECRGDG